MKKLIRLSFIAALALSFTLSGCKKDSKTEEDDTPDQMKMASDESSHNTESEAAFDDANTAMVQTSFGKGNPIAGATIDSTSIAEKKVIIKYNGLNINGTRKREGNITVQLVTGSKWRDQGATLKITFTNFKVTRVSDDKSIIFNGELTIVNSTGGKIFESTTSSVIHRATGSMNCTFDDGTTRIWNISRKRTFTNTAGVLSVTTEGEGAVDGNTNLITWGTNRKGNMFYTQISQPIVFSSACPGKPVAGQKIHKSSNFKQMTVTAGLDDNGNPVSSGTCPTSFKIQWTNAAGKSKEALINY